jgi:hypothetical protein
MVVGGGGGGGGLVISLTPDFPRNFYINRSDSRRNSGDPAWKRHSLNHLDALAQDALDRPIFVREGRSPAAISENMSLSGPIYAKRGLTKQEAAEYCGCNTLAAFDRWRRVGVVNIDPIPGSNVYDRKALDAALDVASGIVTESAAELSPYLRWKADNACKAEATQT